jgi:GNAT superfamily N-acetyltransferase
MMAPSRQSSPIRVRAATTADAGAIFAARASNEDAGPWRDPAECRSHLEWMLAQGNPPLVAELAGEVLAEMEVWWGSDVPELERTLDLSMLYVRRERHRAGLGSALLQHALAMARAKGCKRLTVWTDADALGFYRRHGLEPALTLTRLRLAPPAEAGGPSFSRARLAELAEPPGSHMQTQRILHPVQRWRDLLAQEAEPPAWPDGSRRAAVLAFRADAGEAGPIIVAYRLKHWQGAADEAELFLWSRRRERAVLRAAAAQAAGQGIASVDVLAYGEVAGWFAEMGAEATGEETVLCRSLERAEQGL